MMAVFAETKFSCADNYVVPAPLENITSETYLSAGIEPRYDAPKPHEVSPLTAWHQGTRLVSEFSEPASSVVDPGKMPPEALHLERCLYEVQDWLGIGLNFAAKLCGISRSSIYAMRERGSKPRQSTLSNVFNFHSVVKYSVRKHGIEVTREIFNTGNPSFIHLAMNSADDQEVTDALSRITTLIFKSSIPTVNVPFAATRKFDSDSSENSPLG